MFYFDLLLQIHLHSQHFSTESSISFILLCGYISQPKYTKYSEIQLNTGKISREKCTYTFQWKWEIYVDILFLGDYFFFEVNKWYLASSCGENKKKLEKSESALAKWNNNRELCLRH